MNYQSDTRVVVLSKLFWSDRYLHPARVPIPDQWRDNGFDEVSNPMFIKLSFSGARAIAWNDVQGFPVRFAQSYGYSELTGDRMWYGPILLRYGWPSIIHEDTPDGMTHGVVAFKISLIPFLLNLGFYSLIVVLAIWLWTKMAGKASCTAAGAVAYERESPATNVQPVGLKREGGGPNG